MWLEPLLAFGAEERKLGALPTGWRLDDLAAGSGPWEVEVGFGKGRYLLGRAHAEPERRFLGIEVVSKYFHLAARRARRHQLGNVVLARGEALYLLAAVLPTGFAEAVHVYFPDPWPKKRQQKRRLLDPESVDLVLGALVPGGRLVFATDFLEYGEKVAELLAAIPELRVERRGEPWPDGGRTNYELKYLREGRPILRLEAWLGGRPALHPRGRLDVIVGPRSRDESGEAACCAS